MGNKYKTDTISSVTEIEKTFNHIKPCNINLSSTFIGQHSKTDDVVIFFQC